MSQVLRLQKGKSARPLYLDPFRDKLTHYLVNKKIKRTVNTHSYARLNIFLTYSFSAHRYTNVPIVHYCDQTYELYVKDTGKTTTTKDMHFISIERENLRKAKHIFATNSMCADSISAVYKLENVHWLEGGINLEQMPTENVEDTLDVKQSNHRLLFIGKGAHKRGLDILIEAFIIFNEANSNKFTLDVVGVSEKEILEPTDQVVLHGYLDKSNPADLQKYYDLIRRARIFIMPMRQGPPPGVVREASLMYTPIIVSNIWGMGVFVEHNVSGLLIDELDASEYAAQMQKLVADEKLWRKLATGAHQLAQEGFSWDSTALHFLQVCEPKLFPTEMNHD